jgi:PAS domain S-box-containing protein
MEEALVDYLQKRQAKWQPDLVVPIGSPAGVFVENYRDRLFPQTPILYSGMDTRRPPGRFQKNAAFVGESFNAPSFIEDIVQLAPDTTNIVCVVGASQLERVWTATFQKEFAQFTNRIAFTWLNDLPFDKMLQHVHELPPHSFIFLVLLIRDAAGVTHDADEALARISEVANAPVNSAFEHQLGLGIVGGRLYRDAFGGAESARIAMRILRGETASNIAPLIVSPTGPQYDWRQLRRWKITEDRLPSGSVVKYRVPTTWQRYRSFIITGLTVFAIQALLIAGLVINLNRRRKAERSLRESEERLKLAATAASLSIWERDFATNKIWLDERAHRNGPTKLEHESDYHLYLQSVHPDDRDAVALAFAKATSGDGNYEHVHRQLLPDGQLRWLAARGQVEFDAQHKPVKIRGVTMDVTAQKLAEGQARESDRQFMLIANSAPVLIWTSGTDKLCTFFNQPWLEFTGRTLDQELGNGWTEGVHPEDFENCLKIYTESCDARQPFTMDYRLRRHDGQYRWITDHGVPRHDTQKQFLGYIGSCVDITEKREAETEMQRSQLELAHVSRVSTLGVLAGSLAHELNQPLTSIISNAQAAQRFLALERTDDQEVRDALKDIADQGLRAGAIISGMRAMLKKDPGQTAVQNINLAVRQVLEMVRSDLLARRVTLVLRLDPLLPPVKGHGVQLRQVVLNLVTNACDAMSGIPSDRRKLTIKSRRGTPNEVEVSVADSGPGFPAEMLQHPVEPFRTTKSDGLGLGLAICQSIVAAHGGTLVATNNAGEGATVRFTLPAQNHAGP